MVVPIIEPIATCGRASIKPAPQEPNINAKLYRLKSLETPLSENVYVWGDLNHYRINNKDFFLRLSSKPVFSISCGGDFILLLCAGQVLYSCVIRSYIF